MDNQEQILDGTTPTNTIKDFISKVQDKFNEEGVKKSQQALNSLETLPSTLSPLVAEAYCQDKRGSTLKVALELVNFINNLNGGHFVLETGQNHTVLAPVSKDEKREHRYVTAPPLLLAKVLANPQKYEFIQYGPQQDGYWAIRIPRPKSYGFSHSQ